MPRYSRLHAPGALVHVVARFVNREFRLAGDPERAAFLARLPAALSRSDWTLHAFALMSSHVHLALLAGQDAPCRWLRPLHTSVAGWLNRAQGALGPVFAERATTIVLPPSRMVALVAYLHNNPVRAGLVAHAAESSWTSHRAWLGLEAAPPWLGVAAGLRCAGLDPTPGGRTGFDELVRARAADRRDPELSGSEMRAARRRTRARTGLPVEVSSPLHSPSGLGFELLYPDAPLAPERWQGEVRALLHAVAARTGVTVEDMGSGSHRPRVVRAKRLALLAGARLLRRPQKEIAAAMALSASAASYLLRQADPLLPLAREIAEAVRG